MTKMEKDSINEEKNNEVEKNQFFKSFDEIFETFSKILDFNELDVNRFLSFKDSKKYKFYIMNRILIIMVNYSYIIIPTIVGIVYPLLFGNLFLTMISISGILFIPVLKGMFIIRRFIDENYDYNMSIYRKEKKKMNKYCKQLNLIINNRYVIEELGEKNYSNTYKNKIKRFNNRVDYYSQLFKPLNHYIIQFGLISLVFSFSPIFIDIIKSLIQNQIISTDTLRTSVGYTIFFFVLFWQSYSFINLYIIDDLYEKKKNLTENEPKYNEDPSLYWVLKKKIVDATERLQNLEFGKN